MADNTVLKPIILESSQPVLAVVDGAQFDDLPTALFEGDFTHRPLYLERGTGTADRLKTAPQLVWLDRDRKQHQRGEHQNDVAPLTPVLDRLLDLMEDRPAIVYWVCEGGGDVLYRHLRGINKILLPTAAQIDHGNSYERDPQSTSENDSQKADHELVVFRHCDANVMAQVLPALVPANKARILGPASQILYNSDADWAEKPLRLMHSADMPRAPLGHLTLSLIEVGAIEERRRLAAKRRRISYLRETCPSETEGKSQEALEEHIRISAESGIKLGLISEGAHCRWAFIMCKTGGRVLKSDEALNFISRQGSSPDQQVKRFMTDAMDWMKTQATTGARL